MAFFGTPEFAVPTLTRLLSGRHEVVAVVSQPDRPRGRGRKPQASPVSQAAEEGGVTLYRPEQVGSPDFIEALQQCQPDLGIVAAYGQFLPKRIRELPSEGYLINAHASLLPLYRGASPIAHALLDGREETGISIMKVVREMDAGPVSRVGRIAISPRDNTLQLTESLSQLAADLVEEAVEDIAKGNITWQEQDHDSATAAPRLSTADAQLDFTEPATQLALRVRAMAPKPGATTRLEGEPLRILEADIDPGPTGSTSPGTVARAAAPGPPLRIATGEGWLVPQLVQRAGARVLPVEAFLRGRDVPEGTRLGESEEP